MKKRVAIFLCTIFILVYSGCGAEMENIQFSASDEQLRSTEDQYTENQQIEDQHSEDMGDIEEKSEAESIQDEIAKVEAESCEYENADWDSMGQQEMNQLTAQWYQLWDDELNSLWSRLSDELDAEKKAEVLDEQRAWIKRKEENVKGAGAAAFGGSLQPQLENSAAKEMTRARAYILAGYLADARDETFMVPSEIQASIHMADPNLDDVFQKFEGQWVFDEKRGACVGVERTETCAYGVEGSNWTIWETGGDIISDLDIYGYTGNSILFKVAHDSFDAFYELSSNRAGSIRFAYGTSLDAMDEVVEAGTQEGGDTGPEMTAEELLDLFIDGSISAVYSADPTSSFYITDLNMDSEEWDSYSVGEKVDLDNDGENELVINGPYGGRYLDARDNRVYEFAVADGTALVLSYTYYNGAVWIMYSNTSSAGFEYYHLEKFEGADNLVAEMNFGEEFDVNHAEAGVKYTLNGAEISSEEYKELCSKILAAEVSTN